VVSRPLQLGAEHFRTKADAVERIRSVLYGRPLYTPIAGVDFDLCWALIERHPRAVEKIGCGVQSIDVRPNPDHPGNRGFWITRIDGSVSDWSFVRSLYPTTHADLVRHAMRAAIVDQILAFKNSVFDVQPNVPCAVTGEPCTREDAHIDHAPPVFLELAQRFAEQSGGYDTIRVSEGGDGQIGRCLADLKQLRRWQAFHAQHARLRVVTRLANLSVLRRRGAA
jgi:Protein of unknown function (DUF3223)